MHRITALVSSLALLAGLFVYAPQSVRAADPIYIGPGGGSGECAVPDYETDGSADNEEFDDATNFQEGDIDNILYVCPGDYDIDNKFMVDEPLTIASVSGAASAILDASENDDRILRAHDALTIIGLTFQNAETHDRGAAISADDDLIIQDSIFLNNQSWRDGGAIYISNNIENNNALNITGSTFTGNGSVDNGGAIFSGVDIDLIEDSEFTDNTTGFDGGAIDAEFDIDLIANSKFSGNTADRGGALYVGLDVYEIDQSEFSGNHATAGYGGAIFFDDDLDLIHSSRFLNNSATQGGGAIFVDDDLKNLGGNSAAGLVSNIFEGNEGLDGGAIQIDDDFVAGATIEDNTFLNNVGSDGGAIEFDGDLSSAMSGNRFIGNHANGRGGAVRAENIYASTVITRNTFVNNSSVSDGGAMWLDDSGNEESALAVVTANTFSGNRAEGNGGGMYVYWTDTSVVPSEMTRNTFSRNRADGIGGGIAIMGIGQFDGSRCSPELTTKMAVRAFKKNRFTSNRVGGSRQTANVGAVPCVANPF